METGETSDLWWKNAVVYCVDVETYRDGNGDGIGDFAGLTESIGYLAGIGVTTLWLMPFFASPNRDNGYDISDFYAVDPRSARWATSSSWFAPHESGGSGSLPIS